MKLSPQGVLDFDAVFRYLSDHDLFPKVERERGKARDERKWVEPKGKREEK